MIKLYNDNYIMILIEDNQMLYRHEKEYKKKLKSLGIENGTIIFDTILYSGNTDNRFLTTEIKNGKFKMYRYTTEIGYDHPIRKMTCDFCARIKNRLFIPICLKNRKNKFSLVRTYEKTTIY